MSDLWNPLPAAIRFLVALALVIGASATWAEIRVVLVVANAANGRLPFWKCLGMILARTVALLGLLAVTPAYADDWRNCDRVEDPDPAIHACTRIINKGGGQRKRKNLPVAYANRGAAYYNKGDYDRAIADFDRAIQLKPDDAAAYANRGLAYNTRATTTAPSPTSTGPSSSSRTTPEAYADRGCGLQHQGRLRPRHRRLRQGHPAQAGLCRAYVNRGLAYEQRATMTAPSPTTTGPSSSTRTMPRPTSTAAGLRNKGDYDRAIADYDRAIQLKPDYADAYVGRGVAYGEKGDYDRAIADFDRAIQLKPD